MSATPRPPAMESSARMTSHYWHPFADMHRVNGHELILRRTGSGPPVKVGAAGTVPHSVLGSVRLDVRRAMAVVYACRAIEAAVVWLQ